MIVSVIMRQDEKVIFSENFSLYFDRSLEGGICIFSRSVN